MCCLYVSRRTGVEANTARGSKGLQDAPSCPKRVPCACMCTVVRVANQLTQALQAPRTVKQALRSLDSPRTQSRSQGSSPGLNAFRLGAAACLELAQLSRLQRYTFYMCLTIHHTHSSASGAVGLCEVATHSRGVQSGRVGGAGRIQLGHTRYNRCAARMVAR